MNSEIKILIIEDEAPIQRFLTVLISGYEYQVKVASTAEQGLHLVAVESAFDPVGLRFARSRRHQFDERTASMDANPNHGDFCPRKRSG